MTSSTITIDETGRVRFLWQDELQPLTELGEVDIRRASHVEPSQDGKWWSDLSPSNGPVLGPFNLRQEALDAEVKWLKENHL